MSNRASKSQLMFGLFKKNPIKKLEKEHQNLLEKAVLIQRSGDLRAYAVLMQEAEVIQSKIFALKAKS